MTLTIISVGTRLKASMVPLVEAYEKRLPKHVRISWAYIPHANGDPRTSKQQEAEAILRKVPKDAFVIVLDERGKQMTSYEHSSLVFGKAKSHIVYIIGGAYGVDVSVNERADLVWSLGILVFPHQLVRLMLVEQIYRAYAIHTDHPYHHD